MSQGQPAFGQWPRWIGDSYQQQTGEQLAEERDLYAIPAVVLCHDTSPDPLFVYANLAAQRLWERDWREFIGWPSRLTAPPEVREERSQALSGSGLVRGYTGVRVSRSGRLFRIRDAVVWPVRDNAGVLVGQAAAFEQWEALDEVSRSGTDREDRLS